MRRVELQKQRLDQMLEAKRKLGETNSPKVAVVFGSLEVCETPQ